MMKEMTIQSHQQPGLVCMDNFLEMKSELEELLTRYNNIAYTEDMLKEAKADKKDLTRLRKELEDRRKEVKKAYLEPYNNFEAQVKELVGMIDVPLDDIKEFISDMDQREKDEKKAVIRAFYDQHSGGLGELAGQLWENPLFFDSKWLNKTTKAKTWQDELLEKIGNAQRDLDCIRETGGQYAAAMSAKYLERMDLTEAMDFRDKVAQVRTETKNAGETGSVRKEEDRRVGSCTLKLTGTVDQMAQVMELLELAGVEYEELEDSMPHPMEELTRPDFDTFVAFDLETTGTYGAANGDAPAEITEIGAVKVVNGEIVERFSQLVNPGRKILPRITRITHITDDMVADQPDVNTAIRAFAEFVGELPLVGHNIKSSDLYYIDRAAQRAGVRIENRFFDTYRFAKQFKAAQGWDKLNLPYLSDLFGISQPEAHRAWCDAQANVGVYFKLKEL